MKLTEQDKQLFSALSKSEMGKQLSNFISRMEGDICDVRNWTEKDSVQSAQQAARALRELRSRLNTHVGDSQNDPNEYV